MIKKLFQNLSEREKIGSWLLSQKVKTSAVFFYLLVLFLPTQFGKHFWPNFSYVYGIRIDYLSPTLHVTDLLLIGLIVSWLLEYLVRIKVLRKTIKINKFKFLTIFFLLIFLFIGAFRSYNPSVAIYGIIKFIEYVFLFSYTANNFRTLNKRVLFWILICGVMFESLLTIIQYINMGSVGGILYFLGERSFNSQTPGIANALINGQLFLRPYATFSHPNVLAGYLFIFMTLIIICAKKKLFNKQSVVMFMSLIFGSIALFLTMSRVVMFAWSGFILFISAYGFWNNTGMVSRKNNNLHLDKNKITLLLLFIVVLFILTFPIGLRFFQFSFSDQAFVQRTILIQDSIAMFYQSPIFGVGLNNYLVNIPLVQKQYGEALYIQPVHNIYLLVLSEAGITGLTFLIYCLWSTYKRLKINTNVELLVLFIFILLLGFFDHYFFTIQQGQLLFVIIFGLFWANFKNTVKQKNGNIKI